MIYSNNGVRSSKQKIALNTKIHTLAFLAFFFFFPFPISSIFAIMES